MAASVNQTSQAQHNFHWLWLHGWGTTIMTAHNTLEKLNQESGTQPIMMPALPSVKAAQLRPNRPAPGLGSKTQPQPSLRLTEPKPIGRVGQILSGRYRLVAQLGTGAMGEVYRALDLQRKRHCAVKLISPDAPASLQAHQRFMNEAQIVSRLSHPNIIEVHEFNEDRDGTPYLVMEILEGEDLQALVTRCGRLPLEYSLRILSEVGAGLHFAHELGVVHRDVKPNNIFLCQQKSPVSKNRELAKILDFGLAKLVSEGGRRAGAWSLEQPQLTRGIVVGTPAYMPPETLLGESETVDPRSDQWALAVIAYEMLSGQLPFAHEDLEDPLRICRLICTEDPIPLRILVPGLPPHVYYAIEVAMSKKREHRFSSIGDFLRTLANQPLRGQPPLGGAAVAATAELSPAMAATAGTPGPVPVPLTDLRTVEYSAAELQALTRQSRDAPEKAEAGPLPAAPEPALATLPGVVMPVIRDCRETLLFDRPVASAEGLTILDLPLPAGPASFPKWRGPVAAVLAGALLLGLYFFSTGHGEPTGKGLSPPAAARRAESESEERRFLERRVVQPFVVVPLHAGTDSPAPAATTSGGAAPRAAALPGVQVRPNAAAVSGPGRILFRAPAALRLSSPLSAGPVHGKLGG